MKDLTSRKDIELLMNVFYNKALIDPTIGYLFTDIAQLDLASHLPVICDFWEMVIFKKYGYKKDVLDIHRKLNDKAPLQAIHFEQWLTLFTESVNEHFAGANAEQMKTRALSIATVMQMKFHKSP